MTDKDENRAATGTGTGTGTGTDMVVESIAKNVIEHLEVATGAPASPEVEEEARREAERVLGEMANSSVPNFVPVLAEREVAERLQKREGETESPPTPAR